MMKCKIKTDNKNFKLVKTLIERDFKIKDSICKDGIYLMEFDCPRRKMTECSKLMHKLDKLNIITIEKIGA